MSAGFDIAALRAATAAHGRVARVVVARVRGSAPRAPGASMLVWEDGFSGTIGGGALEFEALSEARRRLRGGAGAGAVRYPLGPALGQCCGGAATLVYELFDAASAAALDPEGGRAALARPLGGVARLADAPLAIRAALRAARGGAAPGVVFAPGTPDWIVEPTAPEATPLYLYGAGHVGRALTRVLEGLPFDLRWVDDARARFPETIPDHAAMIVAADPADAASTAPRGAVHLVMTYSHALDLEICHRALLRGCARLGVIGSATKAARFRSRLRALGHDAQAVAAIACPIGDPSLGKAPGEVAVAVAADLLAWRAARAAARGDIETEAPQRGAAPASRAEREGRA